MIRPTTKRKETVERELEHTIPPEIAQAALRYWMKRNFAEYRAFEDHEIEFEFLEDGSIIGKAYSNKGRKR